MTRQEARDALTRWGKILGIIGSLLVLGAALTAAGDDRYPTRREYESDQAKVAGKIDRVLDVVCEGKEQTRACQQP